MLRRDFLKGVAAALGVALVPFVPKVKAGTFTKYQTECKVNAGRFATIVHLKGRRIFAGDELTYDDEGWAVLAMDRPDHPVVAVALERANPGDLFMAWVPA